jgi:GT2 family glycosyltransferase
MSMCEKLTISIVSHRHGSLLPPLLSDLQNFVPRAKVIVTVNVPDAGFDETAWPAVEFRHNPAPKGFGANHNAALRAASTDWLLVLNPDIRIEPGAFDRLQHATASMAPVGLFAPQVVDPDGTPQDSARVLPTPSRVISRAWQRITGREPPVDAAEQASWFAGMFLLMRRSAFREAGGFDERFFMYCEDVALSMQFVERGWGIFRVEEAVVVHDARRATLRSWRHLRWHIASYLRLWLRPAFYGHEKRLVALHGTAPADPDGGPPDPAGLG